MPIYAGPFQELYDNGGARRIGWRPPAGARGLIDLRPLASQAVTTGGGDGGECLVFMPAGVDPGAEYRRVPRTMTPQQLAGLQNRLGLAGAGRSTDRAAFLQHLLTTDGDPDGDTRHRPIQPARNRNMVARIGPHRMRWRFELNGQAHAAVVLTLRRIYAKIRQQQSPTAARKWLGYQRRKFQLKGNAWQQLQPAAYRNETPLEPSTTLTETWPTPSQTADISGVYAWTEGTGWDVSAGGNVRTSGAINPASPYTRRFARCDEPLSADDMTATATCPTDRYTGSFSYQLGILARVAPSPAAQNTAYLYFMAENQTANLHKAIGGTFTQLQQVVSGHIPAYPLSYSLDCQGSTITGSWPEYPTWNTTATDSAIVGNNNFGLYCYNNHTANSFEWSQITATDGEEHQAGDSHAMVGTHLGT